MLKLVTLYDFNAAFILLSSAATHTASNHSFTGLVGLKLTI